MQPLKEKQKAPQTFSKGEILGRGTSEDAKILRETDNAAKSALKKTPSSHESLTKKRLSVTGLISHLRPEHELDKKLKATLELFQGDCPPTCEEALDLVIRSHLIRLVEETPGQLTLKPSEQNREYSPRAHALWEMVKEDTPHLDEARNRFKSLLETLRSYESLSEKGKEMQSLFHTLSEEKSLLKICELLKEEKISSYVKNWALKILFISETDKDQLFCQLESWLEIESASKVKQIITTFFYELKALPTKYVLTLSSKEKGILSRIRAREIERCFYTTGPLFKQITLNRTQILELDQLADCDPKLHFFCRLILSLYKCGFYPAGDGSKAMRETKALMHLSEISWEIICTQTPNEQVSSINLNGLTAEILAAFDPSQESLEAFVMDHLTPIAKLLRLATPSAWNIFHEDLMRRSSVLWTSPYWTRLEQNILLDIDIESVGSYSVAQTKTYAVYPKKNPDDPESTLVDLERPLAYLTYCLNYQFQGMKKGGLEACFQLKNLEFTPHAKPRDRKTITQSIVNYKKEAHEQGVFEPRAFYSH